MQLAMYFKSDVIETVPLERSLIPTPGYLGQIKRALKEKHVQLVQQSSGSVEFLLRDASCYANAVSPF